MKNEKKMKKKWEAAPFTLKNIVYQIFLKEIIQKTHQHQKNNKEKEKTGIH